MKTLPLPPLNALPPAPIEVEFVEAIATEPRKIAPCMIDLSRYEIDTHYPPTLKDGMITLIFEDD